MAYASKYYDPDKAHAYYERTKVLKGYENRYGGSRGDGTSAASTSGYLSDYQKAANTASVNNTRINRKIEKLRSNSSSESQDRYSTKRDDIRLATAKKIAGVRSEINSLREKLKTMSKEERYQNGDAIRKQIEKLQKDIKQIRRDQRDSLDSLGDKKHVSDLKRRDKIQLLKQRITGGSTSGFNEKGKQAAAYIKKTMGEERDALTKKTNDELDNKMLSTVKAFAKHVRALRKNGQQVSNADILRQINTMSGRVAKAKQTVASQNKSSYVKYYKQEIDKLRRDNSMFTYWDKRKESERRYKRQKKLREKLKRLNAS